MCEAKEAYRNSHVLRSAENADNAKGSGLVPDLFRAISADGSIWANCAGLFRVTTTWRDGAATPRGQRSWI